jgi:DNA (cytosine-5)-methyltransferase 1
MQLLLSTFTGAGLLDKGFQQNGFCVVSAGDLITGQDIRDFKTMPNKFEGVIGGSPCQDFSIARRTPPTGNGLKMIGEFIRIVIEAKPKWFLLENVPQVPTVQIEGYHVQRFNLNATECGSVQNRNRTFQFGSTEGLILDIKRDRSPLNKSRCVTASEGRRTDRRTFEDFLALQGLDADYDLPSFSKAEKYKAIGNGVNVLVAQRVASAIREATEGFKRLTITNENIKFCACGCGRILRGKQKSATDACRKRLEMNIKRHRTPATNSITSTFLIDLI